MYYSRAVGLLCLISGLGGCLCALMAADPEKKAEVKQEAKKDPPSDRMLLKAALEREKNLIQVVTNYKMDDVEIGSGFCGIVTPQLIAEIKLSVREGNPHYSYFATVYATPKVEKLIKSGGVTYPEDTLIIKEKQRGVPVPSSSLFRPPPKNAKPELFTAMLKREKGYNPDCGDWEFIVLSGDCKKVLARGKIDSCMDCHKSHRENDFVTREYIK